MAFWKQNAHRILGSNGLLVLTHTDAVSPTQMQSGTSALYLDYDQRRRQLGALHADRQDDADLKALENNINQRP